MHFMRFFSGFGLLESGSVTTKNEVNIMVKNAVDVIFGGLSYWAFGYALSFGEGKYVQDTILIISLIMSTE